MAGPQRTPPSLSVELCPLQLLLSRAPPVVRERAYRRTITDRARPCLLAALLDAPRLFVRRFALAPQPFALRLELSQSVLLLLTLRVAAKLLPQPFPIAFFQQPPAGFAFHGPR